MKINFMKYLKPCLITILVVVFLAGLAWGIFGFNKGFDFTGGTQLVVEFPYDDQIQTDEGLAQASSKTKEIIANHGAKINSFQIEGENYEKCFVITFKNVSDYNLQEIRLELNKEFNSSVHYSSLTENEKIKILNDDEYSPYDITKSTTKIDGFVSNGNFLVVFATLLFAVIIVMIYTFFRFKFAGGFVMLFEALVDGALLASLILLSRIEVNTYFFVALASVMAISIYSTADFLFNYKQKSKEQSSIGLTSHELSEAVVKENFTRLLIIYAIAGSAFLILGIFSVVNILHLMLTLIVSLIVPFASHLFVLPPLYAFVAGKREIKRKPVEENNNDKQAEVKIVEENNKDNDAEVKEVND